MKKGVLLTILAITLINFVSAAYYGSFSFGDFLKSVDSSLIFLGTTFIVFFAVFNLVLSKKFKENKATASIISFALSLSLTYGINKFGLNLESFFFSLGISTETLYTIIPFVAVALLIFIGIKWGLGLCILLVGGGLIIISFTDLIYEKAIGFILGTIASVIGGILASKRFKKKKEEKEQAKGLKKMFSRTFS